MSRLTMQTTEVHLPNAPFAVYTLEACPTLPKGEQPLLIDCAVRKQLPDGTKILWMPNGNVEKYEPDGTFKIWYSKPTLKDAILSSGRLKFNTMFQFKSDGSVYTRLRGVPYFWSAKQGEPVVGPYDIAFGYNECYGWMFSDSSLDSSDYDAEDYGDRYD